MRLKVSKTDPFRQGQTIVIGKTNSPLCPITAMVAYLNSRPLSSDSGPLFTYVSGGFLTREKLTRETRLLISKGGLDSREFAGHSFRIGAATTAASANLPPWLIKVLGRWSSDCFERSDPGFSVEAGSRRNSAGCEDKCSRLCLGYEILKFAFVNLIK